MVSLGKGIGGHTSPRRGATDDWITPQYIIERLGRFDLDPCQSLTQPWPCAARGYTIRDDGLLQPWKRGERVWLNPPYSNAKPFLERLAAQRNGIGLIFGRTETQLWRDFVWQTADAVLFLEGRLTFFKPDGQKAGGNSGGPSAFVAYGQQNVDALRNCGLPGALVHGWDLQRAT